MSHAHPILNKYMYRINSRFLADGGRVFLNWGYDEDPPMTLPLAESDEPDRYSIQLYHRVATQVDLTAKRVLEVSCGHGGGASYLMRTQHPASYTGLDLNSVGLDFCRKKHQLPGLDFVHGSAEKLPFANQYFDAVINIEASHCYANFPEFLTEVARVLRPGGHFLYADARKSRYIAEWERQLADNPMQLVSKSVINEHVARGIERIYLSFFKKRKFRPSFNYRLWSYFRRSLLEQKSSYRVYCFAKP